MNRDRLFKILMALLILLLLFLLFKFKPSFVGPKKIEIPPQKESSAILSGKNFTYEVKEKNILKYTLYAEEILEKDEEEKELLNPFIIIPKSGGKIDKVSAKKGIFSQSKNILRLYKDAKIITSDNFVIESTGFRVTPQNEIVSERVAKFEKEKMKGSADIARYDRERKISYLEGNVIMASENILFKASSVFIDFENHNGKIEGPIYGKKDDLMIVSPSGRIELDSKNNLENIILDEPVKGETDKFLFSSRNLKFNFKSSKMDEFALISDVVITQKEEPKAKLTTETLIFYKKVDKLWYFIAPSKVYFEKSKTKLECFKGKGIIKNGVITADLDGPVKANDENMESSSTSGKINEDSFEFIGNAQVAGQNGILSAERIITLQSGEKEAYDNVNGKIVRKGELPIFFFSEAAKVAQGIFPIKLLDNVTVKSDIFMLKGSDITVVSNKKMKGCNGVVVNFANDKENIDGYGKELVYDQEKGFCLFTGEPYFQNEGEKISSNERISVYFDENKKIKEIIAEGEAKYKSKNQQAMGDRIRYNLKTKKGEVFSENSVGEVIQKEPFSRSVGRRILFGEKEVSIKGSDNRINRGKIEGWEVEEKR